MSDWLRHSTGLYVSVLLVLLLFPVVGVAQDEEKKKQDPPAEEEKKNEERLVRFINGQYEFATIHKVTDEYVYLNLRDFEKPIPFPWAELAEEDSKAIRAGKWDELPSGNGTGPRVKPPQGTIDKDERLIQFINGRSEYAKIDRVTEEKVFLKLRDVNDPIPFDWVELEAAYVAMLRKEFLGKTAPPENIQDVTLPGVRIRTRKGEVIAGLVVVDSPEMELHLKNREGRFVVVLSDIIQREAVRLKVWEIYTDQELYTVLVGQLQPVTSKEWEKLGAELIRMKLADRAVMAFRIAEMLRYPELPEGRVYRMLLRLRQNLTNLSMKKVVYEIQEAYLVGDYNRAVDWLDLLIRDLQTLDQKDELLEVRRLKEEILLFRNLAKKELIIAEWNRVMEAYIRTRAFDPEALFSESRDYIQKRLLPEVEANLRDRFTITQGDETVRDIWDRRPANTTFKHSAGDATWLLERPERGEPGKWWKRASDLQKYEALKAIAIETHFDVKRVLHKSCPTCGGKGVVSPAKFPDQPAGRCPSCLGLEQQRVLIYR